MKRTLIVVALALAALLLLAGAAIKSRQVPLSAHLARHSVAADLDALAADFETLVLALETAWQTSQAPGDAAVDLQQRITSELTTLQASIAALPGGGLQRDRLDNSFARLATAVAHAEELATSLRVQQAEYARSLDLIRDTGTDTVRQLREQGLERTGSDLFQLIAASMAYAAPNAGADTSELRRLLVTLQRDLNIDSNLPPGFRNLLAAADNILTTRDDSQSRLNQLADSRIPEYAAAVGAAAEAAYLDALAKAENARLMLAVYAVLMLLAVTVTGFRLQGSYRALNRANEQLATLNASLEQRVAERTEDLSSALNELRESQVQLVQAEKMSSLGQLVAGISHEINTPLLYLSNNASLIQERSLALGKFVETSARVLNAGPDASRTRADYQAKLVEGLRTLKILLRDEELELAVEEMVDLNKDNMDGLADLTEMAQSLKDFSRLDRAPVADFDVNAGLEKTLRIARNIVKHKATVRKFYGELPPIECSPSQINQVFLNLITNAAQAIEDQGEIVISTNLQDSEHVIIAIADTGCGIPEQLLSKIRDPFFTTKEIGSGTGLGLSIVDEIIRSHGGELHIDSRVGAGSTFSVVLPVRQQAAADDSDLAEAV